MSIFVRPFFKAYFTKPNLRLPFCLGFLGCFGWLLVFGMQPALAEEQPCDLCVPQWIAPPMSVPPLNHKINRVQANSLTQPNAQNYHFQGHVAIKHPGSLLFSNQATINRTTQTATAWGKVRLYRKSALITADKLILNQAKKTAHGQSIQYQLTQNRSHGTAKQIKLNQIAQIANLKSATYTTCPITHYDWLSHFSQQPPNPKNYAWQLNFSTLELNQKKRRIYGYNTWLTFQKVPIFYTPYLSIPMDKRASGLLFPTFGSYKSINSDVKENYFAQPYYFNLAPNMDDTLTAIKMQDRGTVLDNEFRYLGHNNQATVKFSGLNDVKAKQQNLSSQRWSGQIDAQQTWGKGFSSDQHWIQASDKQYFNDIPNNPGLQNITQTERHLNLKYQQSHFNAHLNMTDYLRLGNNAAYNYEKRPEFSLDYQNNLPNQFKNIQYQVGGIVTDFELAQNPNTARAEGQRRVFNPSIEYHKSKSYGFLQSKLVFNQVQYSLNNDYLSNTANKIPNITVPQWGIKTGLNFERNGKLGKTAYIQTLEPVIQYLYVPYQKQSQTPLFDTSARSLDFSNLFSYNRFSGYDRIGDTNQVSMALTTRFLSEDGLPLAEAALGQVIYLEDRKVQLNASTPTATSRVSDYFVKLAATLGPVYLSSTSQYSRKNYALTNASSRAKLSLSPNFKLLMVDQVSNLNLPGEQETAAAGFYWKMSSKWSLGAYANYNFTLNLNTENEYALRYESCCWASELSVNQAQLSNGLYNYSIAYNFELKGLSSVGTRFTNYLHNKLNF